MLNQQLKPGPCAPRSLQTQRSHDADLEISPAEQEKLAKPTKPEKGRGRGRGRGRGKGRGRGGKTSEPVPENGDDSDSASENTNPTVAYLNGEDGDVEVAQPSKAKKEPAAKAKSKAPKAKAKSKAKAKGKSKATRKVDRSSPSRSASPDESSSGSSDFHDPEPAAPKRKAGRSAKAKVAPEDGHACDQDGQKSASKRSQPCPEEAEDADSKAATTPSSSAKRKHSLQGKGEAVEKLDKPSNKKRKCQSAKDDDDEQRAAKKAKVSRKSSAYQKALDRGCSEEEAKAAGKLVA